MIADGLRDASLLARTVEQHYTARQMAKLINRSEEYVSKLCTTGQLGNVSRDDRGWMIPTSSVQRWLDLHRFEKSNRVGSIGMGERVENNLHKEHSTGGGLDGVDNQAGIGSA
jgi:hypothetical protein